MSMTACSTARGGPGLVRMESDGTRGPLLCSVLKLSAALSFLFVCLSLDDRGCGATCLRPPPGPLARSTLAPAASPRSLDDGMVPPTLQVLLHPPLPARNVEGRSNAAPTRPGRPRRPPASPHAPTPGPRARARHPPAPSPTPQRPHSPGCRPRARPAQGGRGGQGRTCVHHFFLLSVFLF